MGPTRRPTWHDAYDAQMALWRWYRTPGGQRWLSEDYAANARGLPPETQQLLDELYASEAGDRLLMCDPIFVSAEMCEVIDAAKDSFELEPLLESDVVTPRGFMLYETPFDVPDRFDNPTTIKAVSWTRTFAVDSPETRDAIEDALREAGGSVGDLEDLAIDRGARPNGISITLYAGTPPELAAAGMPTLAPIHLTPWWFGMSFDGNEVDPSNVPTGAAWWWKIAQTTFRLMQQRIASKHLARPDRASRREAKRAGFPDDTDVVVVRLRREESEGHDGDPEDANYSHRFIVSGHWRNQWYASHNLHRQIWVSAYVKGPEDKPLIVRPRRVFMWSR